MTDTVTLPAPAETSKVAPRRSKWARVANGVETVMTFVAVIIGTVTVIIAVASHFSPPGQYTVFGHPVMSVLSGSMSPTIKTGDLIIDNHISLAQAEHLRVGQVISFRPNSADVFTHRIHAVTTVGGSVAYQTKGDANNAPDTALVMPTQVVGLYEGKVPLGGYILNALHKPVTLGLLLAAPFLWLLSGWLLGLASETGEKTMAGTEREEASPM